MHIEAMGKSNGCTIANVRGNFVAVNIGLQFIGRCHHHQVSPFGSFCNRHHLEAVGFNFLRRGRASLEADNQILGTRILEVQRMGAALRAIADDGHFLALDQVYVSIPVIIYAHWFQALFVWSFG